MQREFRAGLSRAQCSIAYNGNMGVCNQCQRYRWRLTVPGLLCSSRTSFYRNVFSHISENACSTNAWKRKRGICKTRLRRGIKDLHTKRTMMNTIHHWSWNIAAEKPEEKFVRKQRFIYRSGGYKICLSLLSFDRILPSICDTDKWISSGELFVSYKRILNLKIRIKESTLCTWKKY